MRKRRVTIRAAKYRAKLRYFSGLATTERLAWCSFRASCTLCFEYYGKVEGVRVELNRVRLGGRLLAIAGLLSLFCLATCPHIANADPASVAELMPSIGAAAPSLSSEVLKLALKATSCAYRRLNASSRYLAIIDYSLPSSTKRFWLLDLEAKKLLREELVAHGKGSGEDLAVKFSNQPGSLQSSLGLFAAAESYIGGHGYSLRLRGLESGYNDNAYARDLVVHGADYVSESFIEKQHRLGRSWGCPALPSSAAKEIIKILENGAFLFAYYPDKSWLNNSSFLHQCSET